MASKYSRRNVWWVKFRHPATGEVVRESLETTEEPRAELLRERVELEAALRDPRLGIYPMPQRLGNLFGIGQPAVCPSPIIVPASFEPAPAPPR